MICFLLAACQTTTISQTPTSHPTQTSTVKLSSTPESILTSVPTSTVTSSPIEELIPEFTASPEPELAKSIINGVREEIEASDGLYLVGTYYSPVDIPPPWPGVILLHMLFGDRTSWDDYARQLASTGYAVFALDMRGHGETGGLVNWEFAENDIQQIWNK